METAKIYPKISIVCQCFNREGYIGGTIDSVLSQNYPNIELIVIDDGSTDKSWDIIQSYGSKIAYAEQLLEGRNRRTPVPSLNYGLAKATGDIFTTLNDKNILLPGSLLAMAEVFMEFPDVEWVTGINAIVNKDGIITNIMPIRKDLWQHLYFVTWNIQHESTFWRRSLWERSGFLGFSEEWPWAFDAELWSRFFGMGAKLYYLNTIVGAYRKLPTAHGTKNRGEYQALAKRAWSRLQSEVPASERYWAILHRVLWYAKPILRNIPDAVYAYIPLLNHFAQDAIKFEDINKESGYLIRYKRNPFRTLYPW
jgi:glycosyltransferase involved in cell wall biosynthesis